ncbi:hypothetical protein GCM10027093_53460 [Paraburkholderia jirisanensis]
MRDCMVAAQTAAHAQMLAEKRVARRPGDEVRHVQRNHGGRWCDGSRSNFAAETAHIDGNSDREIPTTQMLICIFGNPGNWGCIRVYVNFTNRN